MLILTQINDTHAESNYHSASFVSINNHVYEFLTACAAKGIIPISAVVVRPLPRMEIGRLLSTVVSRFAKLDDEVLEAELDYYIREFADEIKLSSDEVKTKRRVRSVRYDPTDALTNPHWHAAKWSKENFSFVFDPIVKADWNHNGSRTIYRRGTGIKFRGIVSDQLAYYFKFVDNLENGNGPYDSRDSLLEDQYGYVGPLQGGNETYYDINSAYLVTSWSKFNLMFGKDIFAWGMNNHRLLFSGESPPFTQLRLTAHFTSKLKFTYVVGKLKAWKASGDEEIEPLYKTGGGWERVIPPEKWVVGHRLDYSPIPEINLSVSEALIWGDRGFELSYLNPLALLFASEHDGGDLDNVLLSGDISVQLPASVIWTGSLLIDDMKTGTLGTGDFSNKFGWSTGLSAHELKVDGLRASINYQKIDPFVYSHFFPVNRFSNWTCSLGSSLNPNSDRTSASIGYRLDRRLGLNIEFQHFRHGDFGGTIYETVIKGENPRAPFLSGNKSEWDQIEVSIDWEPIPALRISAGRIENDKYMVFENRYFLLVGYRY